MPFYTPLRYPGGKRRLVGVIARLLEENRLTDVQYVEPYAGGAAVALALLMEEYASIIHINDLSRPVFAFWQSVLNNIDELCWRVESVKLTMSEWHRQRDVYLNQAKADLLDLGFAALFLNRTNRSGIIGGGVIGGKNQAGAWSLGVRFNRKEITQRLRRIWRYRKRIQLYQEDALAFTTNVLPSIRPKVFAFYDPPYIDNGEALYLNTYDLQDHQRIAAKITSLEQLWVCTYDYAAVRLGLFGSRRRLLYTLPYTAQSRYKGREVMFFSDALRLPEEWLSAKEPADLTPDKKGYSLIGLVSAPVESG